MYMYTFVGWNPGHVLAKCNCTIFRPGGMFGSVKKEEVASMTQPLLVSHNGIQNFIYHLPFSVVSNISFAP